MRIKAIRSVNEKKDRIIYLINRGDINPLVDSVHYKGRLTKILILEGILKKFPMSVATMSR